MTSHRSLLLTGAIGALLVFAPPAAAEDAALFNAYVARQASEVDPAGDAYMRAINRLRRAKTVRGARRAFKAVIRADSGSTAP
jgi:NAD(P)H-hydrate repair Nnr-like enzyme with NAD(P)H-hydrate dehydratase domain